MLLYEGYENLLAKRLKEKFYKSWMRHRLQEVVELSHSLYNIRLIVGEWQGLWFVEA